MKQVWWYMKCTSCYQFLRYISGKYYPNLSGLNGVIAEEKGVTFFETQCSSWGGTCQNPALGDTFLARESIYA